MDIFQSIREQNLIDYGQRFEEWAPRILVDQYSDRTHFLFELLQNAEDAEATTISISLFPDRLVLEHNGRVFTEDDIRGICGVNASIKRNSRDRIGRFGIGFKSVYAYTDKPHIISGKYNYEIKNLIMPYSLGEAGTSNNTCIVLPFDQESTHDTAFQEIAASLNKNIIADCMLTLSHIRKISYQISGRGIKRNRVLSKSVRLIGHGIQDIVLSESSEDGVEFKTKLIAFLSEDPKPVMIAYKTSDSTGTNRTLIPISKAYLYAFFPTAIETHQSFYIHAPFDTTPARDNIKNNEYNRNLIQIMTNLFEVSVLWLRDRRFLTTKFFNQIYPIYKYSEDNLLFPLYTAGIKTINDQNTILPTVTAGVYGALRNTYIPESQNIVQCFDNTMLPALVRNDKAVWMDKAIASETCRDFKEYLQECFNVKSIGWKTLTLNLTAALLEGKPDEWLIALLRNIQPYCYSERSEDHIDAKTLPLVRLQNGKHCRARDDHGKPQVYINNPEVCANKIKSDILSDFFARNFYSRVLEIPVYDVFEEIASDIIPLYKVSPDTISINHNLQHIRLIEKAMSENESRTIELVCASPILYSSKGWISPKETYIPDVFFKSHSNEYDLIEELPVAWLSDTYKGKVSTDFLLKIGCHASPEICDLEDDVYIEWLSRYDKELANKYITLYSSKTYHTARDGFNHRRIIAYLGAVLENLSLNASFALAEFVASNLTTLKLCGTLIAANDAAFRGRSTITIEDIPSAIGLLICNRAWIYKRDGITKESACKLKRSEIHPEYERHAQKLLECLPFIHEDNLVQELLEHYDPRYQAFLSELLQNQESLKEAFTSYSNKKALREAKESKANAQSGTKEKSQSSIENYKPEEVTSESLNNDDDPIVQEVVRDIVKQTRTRKKSGSSSVRNSDLRHPEQPPVEDEYVDEDEYIKAPVDYEKRIEAAKNKSAGEIDRIARFEYLQRKALTAKKYSFAWFCTLLEMEALNSVENNQNSKEISITFGKVELEPGTIRTLILKQPSRFIPQYMEDLADIPLILSTGDKTKTVAIEVANVQSYSLRVKLRTNAELDGIDLSQVREAKINARNPVFLIEALRKQFNDLNYSSEFDMRDNLPHNIEFVFGPPGTGKTTYLATNVLPSLLQEDKVKVLVLTPTNKAADVLTQRIVETMGDNTSYLSWLVRFGITNDESLEKKGVFRDKTFDIRTLEKSVTVTTIARFSYDYFMPKDERLYLYDLNWDYIIIDEASMIPIANIVLPLYKKTPKKFVVAGDPFQIEPISSISLWKDENIYTMVELDSFTNPNTVPIQYPVTLLTTQYRSIPAIGAIFSSFAYGGILQHHRQADSQKDFHINNYFDLNTLNIIKYPVSKYESIYRAKTLLHRSPYHIYAALFTYELIEYLGRLLKEERQYDSIRIGVIAPYRAQADLINKLLSAAQLPDSVTISVGTIHSFQGDECDIVIVVFNPPPVISNAKEMFLNKTNIINVAISRARDYLIVIMPDENTEGIENLKLIKRVEGLITSSGESTVFDSHYVEELMFGNERYLEDNSFSTSHQNVNVYGLPEKKYEIRSEDTAVDIQVHQVSV